MISKDRLLAIPELNLVGNIENMTDMQLNFYTQSLNSFVDKIPSLAENLRSTLKTNSFRE